ncbi:galectin-3-like [Lampris incognitus]|uniref:galectin-3-like n=1 Tax=Lampris incognitus TaxID=2546036 RepID=UPI0024B5FFF7|nr:galectin-3-like [Lampris incognitus]
MSIGCVRTCKLVSSILSTLSLPRISILADPTIFPSSPSASSAPLPLPQHSDVLCGGCPSSGSVPQGNNFWPNQPVGGVPVWPGQATQPPPCWSGQPNTPCWPGTQPATVPAPVSSSSSASAPAPAAALTPTQIPTSAPFPAPVQPCQPCWPGPQYQPLQPQQPPAPAPAPTPAPAPVPTIQPSVPGWPASQGWPYNPGQPGWPGQNPSIVPPQWPLPPTSGPLSVPYNLNLTRGVYDKMMMTIMGYVKPSAKMFTVNFLRGNDIAFHINPRFHEGGKQVVVRNHKVGERWGSEERGLKAPFPFAPGSPFEMKILSTYEEFRVAVNNIPLFDFRHRVRELNQIDRINILHDVVLTYINVETLP